MIILFNENSCWVKLDETNLFVGESPLKVFVGFLASFYVFNLELSESDKFLLKRFIE